MRRAIGYGLIIFGMMGILYGFSEYMYALRSTQMILGRIMEMKPQLFNDPTYQAIINLAMGQSTAMKVLAYIVPGFIVAALGFMITYMDDIIKRLDGYAEAGAKVLDELNNVFNSQDEIIELTDEMEIKDEEGASPTT
jgi:hypothetical protein